MDNSVDIGISILVSSTLFGLIILYVSTRNSWNWVRIFRIVIRIVIYLFLIFIFVIGSIVGYHKYKEYGKDRVKSNNKKVKEICSNDDVCSDISNKLFITNLMLLPLKSTLGDRVSKDTFDTLMKISTKPLNNNKLKQIRKSRPFSFKLDISIKNKSLSVIHNVVVMISIIDSDRDNSSGGDNTPLSIQYDTLLFEGGITSDESRIKTISFYFSEKRTLEKIISGLGNNISFEITVIDFNDKLKSLISYRYSHDKLLNLYNNVVRRFEFEKSVPILEKRKLLLEKRYKEQIDKIRKSLGLKPS